MQALQPNVGPGPWRLFGLRFWGVLIAGSVATGLAAGLLMKLLWAVEHLAWNEGGGTFLDGVQHSGSLHRVLVVSMAGLLVIATRLLLRLRGSGHGGELTAAIWFGAGTLPPLRTVANAVTSILIVALGASLGREAAPKQTGALFAGLLARWAALPPTQRRLLVACGAGAGMGAVYNVPFGGALFALEVLLGTLSLPLIAPALLSSLIATSTAWLLLADRATYEIGAHAVTPQLFIWAAVAGPLFGAASAIYVRLIVFADARKPSGRRMFVAPLIVFAALGGLAIPFPQLLGNGKDTVQLAFDGTLPLLLALCLAALKPLATGACLGSGAPGGLFTPTLTVGGLLGVAGGHAVALLWPQAAPDAATCALIGAGAMLAASTQGPVSAIVLLLELTRRLDSTMVPLMLAVAGAILVARTMEARSIYSGRIRPGREAAAEDDEETISVAARLPEVMRALAQRPDGAIAVIDPDGRVVGRLSRACAIPHLEDHAPTEILTARDLLPRDPEGVEIANEHARRLWRAH